MKTYSRKSSCYLKKKAFIASNFNEMCRLCLSEVDMFMTPIIQDSQMSYKEWIHYSVDVLVEEGDGLPPNICEECLGMVEQSYLFKKKCKASDSKLREHLQLMEANDRVLNEYQFESVNNLSLSTADEEPKYTQIMPEPNLVDPGGIEKVNPESSLQNNKETETKNNLKAEEGDNNKLDLKRNLKKVVVKPISEENIVVNEVKRYVWKDKKIGEKNVTVCEIVHCDLKESDDSNDGSEDGKCNVQSYSTGVIASYCDNISESQTEPSNDLILLQNVSTVRNSEASFLPLEQGKGIEKSEGKIQEICQLWDNDEEETTKVSSLNGGRVEGEKEDGLVVDVSWEEDSCQKNNDGNKGIVEVNFEENGVIQTHKVFTSENYIQLIGNMSEKKEIKCFMCNNLFSSNEEMRIHLSNSHKEASNSLFCELCYKSFTSNNSLKRHMLVHSGIKPYECDICGRKFSQTSILKRHMFTHGKKKPFECEFCQKSYAQKMNLLTHLRNHGVKAVPVGHRCKLCHKSFVHPSGLSRHLKQHKGVRFNCTCCTKSFSDPSTLSRHMKAIHQ